MLKIILSLAALCSAASMQADQGQSCIRAPTITKAVNVNGRTKVKGTLLAAKKTKYIIQFFGNDSDRSPITEGGDFFGQVVVYNKSHKKKLVKFSTRLPVTQSGDPVISATATKLEKEGFGPTSPFSRNFFIKYVP